MKLSRLFALSLIIPVAVAVFLLSKKTDQTEPVIEVIPEVVEEQEPVGGYEIDPGDNSVPVWILVAVKGGDTLSGILTGNGIDSQSAQDAVDAFSEVYDPRRLKPGYELTLYFDGEEKQAFSGFIMHIDPINKVSVMRVENGLFEAKEYTEKTKKQLIVSEGTITSSLYASAVSSGLPMKVLMQLIQIYSFDVDFQRDIHPGDHFALMFEQDIDDTGRIIQNGDIVYACLILQNRELEIYRYEDNEGKKDYYNPQGKSVRKTLLKTPIPGARITSGYGMRISPVKGYSRFHPAVDFAAPIGTPIYASGDGYILYVGYDNVYGRFIRLSHANGYETLYAHLSSYARSMRKGLKVTQGQTIGFVGNTGMSTGPHLHYEVRYRGKQINPSLMEIPPGKILEGEDLLDFKLKKQHLIERYYTLQIPEKPLVELLLRL